ncbi:MAG: AbgT family transporter [Clostridiales bacterium]|nr:AbgT family transporter [Clostridiales bacterium]
MSDNQKKAEGLNIDKKTLFGIAALLAIILVLVGVLTQVLPRSEYKLDENGSIMGGEENYKVIDDYKLEIWKIVASPVLAFTSDKASVGLAIIAIIVLVGGTFLILDRIGVLKYIMASIVNRFERRRYILIAAMVFFGMFLSSTAGVLEESLTLVPIAVAISLAMGWDSLTGIGMSFVAVAFGFTAATFNPFNVITVQKLAGIPVLSGLWLRLIIFVAVYLSLTAFLILYARKIEKHPEKSPAFESDQKIRDRYPIEVCRETLGNKQIGKATKVFVISLICVLGGTVASFVLSMAGTKANNETLTTIGSYASMGCMAIFFPIGGLLAGRIAGLRGKKLFGAFAEGIKTILPVIPLIVFILAITWVLDEGKIMHTILHALAHALDGISAYGVILLMFVFIALLEFFVSSGTAKAFLIVPLMASLCELTGLAKQSVVITFCFADGFTNMLYPTSGLMIIAIGMVGVSYGKWLKWTAKLFLIEAVISVFFMLFSVYIGYQ